MQYRRFGQLDRKVSALGFGAMRLPRIDNDWIMEEERADLCIACGQCLAQCPQGIEIPDRLAQAHEFLYREEASEEQL